MKNNNPVLEVKKISKYFPGVQALSDVDLTLYPGEVHILAGENGAGKSTLSKCILGVYHPDEGEILYRGENITMQSTQQAIERGIVAVHQEFTIIPYLNAAENIFFNREPVYGKTGIINRRKMEKQAKELLSMLHCEYINIRKPVQIYGVATQQMIEIAKALSTDPKVIIFDEPTAALSEREVNSLFEQIRKLKERGIAIVYISHRMEEFARIGDRISVLRDGKYIATYSMEEMTEQKLISDMVGREIHEIYHGKEHVIGEEILRVEKLADKKGKVRECSLTLRRGEIVGLAGLVGAGRTELARLIYGIDKVKSGNVYLDGKDVTGWDPQKMVGAGLGMLPEDRKQFGLATRSSVSWNVTSASLNRVFPSLFIDHKKHDQIAGGFVSKLKIATPDVSKKAGELSGGNQQKVVISKWLLANTQILIFDEPTRGIDIGAKMEIYQLLHKLAGEGKAILLISSDMPELIGMCDRMYILKEGQIQGELDKSMFEMEKIGRMMM